MLVRLADGNANFFDYREVAPGKATRNMYIKGRQTDSRLRAPSVFAPWLCRALLRDWS